MPVHFGMKEFAIVTDLNCHLPPRYVDVEKKLLHVVKRYQCILDALGKKNTCQEKRLVELLNFDDVGKSVKKSLCLVFFVHSILCGKDQNTNVPAKWIELSADKDAFSAYL